MMRKARIGAALLLAVSLVIGIVGAAAAQPPTVPPQSSQPSAKSTAGHRHRLGRQLHKLGLTKQQKEQIKPIVKNAREKTRAIRNNPSLTPSEKRTQILKVRRDAYKQIKPNLTPEQQKKMQAMRRHHRNAAAKPATQ
jgi:Spy/CpxP family protein refolding chaperone